jgi:UDP-glucose 4-epimerase
VDSPRQAIDSANGARPTVLVTGGSGFIGSHVVDVLERRGYRPRIFDLRESPHHEAGSVDTVVGDATDIAALTEAMRGCGAVIHLAAMADVGHVQKDPVGAERLNSRATAAVLEAARESGVGRVVYGSTIWVYSDCEPTNVDESTPLTHPAHLYSATKLAGELYCRSYAELYEVDYTILRFGIPYGPRARVAAVVPAMVERALNGEPLTIAGDGSQGRRFVYVEDLAAGVVEALKPEAANRIYNLAGTETTTIGEIAYTVKDLLGDVEILHTEARPGDFGGKEVSSERALAELGWSASTPFREGVSRYVAWRREHDAVAGEPVKQPALEPAGTTATRSPWLERLVPRVPSFVPSMRQALSMAAVAASLGWGVLSDDSFGTLTRVFGGGPTTGVQTTRPEVGVLIDTPTAMASDVAKELRADGATGSIGLTGKLDASTLAEIRAAGSDALPRLKPGGPVRWVGTRSQIKHLAHDLGVTGHIYYEAPTHGFTYTQSLLAHTAGASAVKGRVRIVGVGPVKGLDRGDIVQMSIDGTDWRARLHSLVRQLRSRHLRAVPADDLLRRKA